MRRLEPQPAFLYRNLGGGKFVFATANGNGNLYIWDGLAGTAATAPSFWRGLLS